MQRAGYIQYRRPAAGPAPAGRRPFASPVKRRDMATQHSSAAARLMISPAVVLLLLWMIVPLAMTL